jgi:hypothetical protein
MDSFVINGLVRRRAALAGDIERTYEALRKMVLDLEALAAAHGVDGFHFRSTDPTHHLGLRSWPSRQDLLRSMISN